MTTMTRLSHLLFKLLRCRLNRSTFLFLLCLFLILARLTYIDSPPVQAHSSRQTTTGDRITIWHIPSGCGAKYSTTEARDSPDQFPYAVVRDVVVDRRPAAWKELGKNDVKGTWRFVAYVTAHLSARLTREKSSVSVGPDLLGKVEYVTQSTTFLTRGEYKPGKKTVFGREVSEWQFGIKLQPKQPNAEGSESLVRKAVTSGESLNVNLTVVRYDGVTFPLQISLRMNCILGWEDIKGGGSVLFSGSALYGEKRKSLESYREVGNFAARAFGGLVRYDLVVMSVVSVWSAEDIWRKCGRHESCIREMEGENRKTLEEVGKVAENELRKIGVQGGRLLIVPSCRLGSATLGGENEDCCKKSKRYGQYFATFFTYAILADRFEWAVSHDMDEFLAPGVPSKLKVPVKAEKILKEADHSVGGGGHLVMQWLNFRLRSINDAMHLSKDVTMGEGVKLTHRGNASLSERCYYKVRDITGKSAVRQDVGLGFTIHHPVVNIPGEGLMRQRQGNIMYYGLRTWHARLRSARGDCDFIPETRERRV